MRRFLSVLLSVFIVFVALAETAHAYEQSCDSPCPTVCLGSACGMYCDDSASERIAGPEETGNRIVSDSASVLVARIAADEIFHPPLF